MSGVKNLLKNKQRFAYPAQNSSIKDRLSLPPPPIGWGTFLGETVYNFPYRINITVSHAYIISDLKTILQYAYICSDS